jgi:hypothetical protein
MSLKPAPSSFRQKNTTDCILKKISLVLFGHTAKIRYLIGVILKKLQNILRNRFHKLKSFYDICPVTKKAIWVFKAFYINYKQTIFQIAQALMNIDLIHLLVPTMFSHF